MQMYRKNVLIRFLTYYMMLAFKLQLKKFTLTVLF